MSLWTLIKLVAALVVLAIMGFSGMLAYHVAVAPLGGVFERIVPNPVSIVAGTDESEIVAMLDAEDLPDVDPGEKAFQKAHELLALGRLPEAREKLTTIVNVFPASPSAPLARRIIGEINLDEILANEHMEGKQTHVVKPGDSFLGIVAKRDTNIDMLMHLNSMLELRNLHPGDELIVMPLNFRLLIEPRRKTVSLWDGGRFIREYLALDMEGVPTAAKQTKIEAKLAELDGKRVPPQSKNYRSAHKLIQLANPTVYIRGWDGVVEKPASGILLRPEDMEELALLTRPGNEVEIR